jgi:hypothetical protein
MGTPRTEGEALLALLNYLSTRLNAIADLEAKQVARGGGPAAKGELIPEKMRLLDSIDKILDRLEALNADRP